MTDEARTRLRDRLPPVRRLLAHVAVAALGALAALLVFNVVFMPLAVGHGKDVAVPSLVGLPYEDALNVLERHALDGRKLAERVDPEWEGGVVLAQDPSAGFATRAGRAIGLVVSMGRGEVGVPAIEGESLRHAEILLTRDGIPVGHLAWRHDAAPAEEVLRVSPQVGTRVVRGRPVDLLLSAGPVPAAYLMPDFEGGDPESVARALRRLGYVVEVDYPPGTAVLGGRIAGQSPQPGHRLGEKASILLRVGDR